MCARACVCACVLESIWDESIFGKVREVLELISYMQKSSIKVCSRVFWGILYLKWFGYFCCGLGGSGNVWVVWGVSTERMNS